MATRIDDQNIGFNLWNTMHKRGITVYNYSSLVAQSARDKFGNMVTADYLIPSFSLSITERIDMVRACSAIFGIVTGRMNTISSLEWKITPKTEQEDDIVERLKDANAIATEFHDSVSPKGRGILIAASKFLEKSLPDLLPDRSNFDKALLRWSRRIKNRKEKSASEIEDWIRKPSEHQTFEDFTKAIIFDTHTHGMASIYKTDNLERLYVLPGGACFPVTGKHVGDPWGVVQLCDGAEAEYYQSDEISIMQFAPYSGDAYGIVPLEALTNKVAEMLMFDQRAATMADGTKPPDKLLAFGERAPWGELGGDDFTIPLEKAEQKRVETLINEARKEGVRVISGHGTPVVTDISRADTFQYQSERQRMVREEVGLVFGASNAEMNLTGSDNTNGRESGKTQERKDNQKGIYPHIKMLENFWNFDIIPQRYGEGWEFRYEPSSSDDEMIDLWTKKAQSGLFSINEIRREDIGKDGFDNPQADLPSSISQQPQEAGGGDELSELMGSPL
jgi:hypothetical protein